MSPCKIVGSRYEHIFCNQYLPCLFSFSFEHATEPPSEPVFYLPHHPVTRESAKYSQMAVNIKELEQDEQWTVNEDFTFAKRQLGNETGNLLGIKWDKEADTIQVIIPPDESTPTKRGILGKVARKLLYREACEQKCKWDDELPDKLFKHWQKWDCGLPGPVKVPRSVPLALEPIHDIALHAFR